MTTAITAGICLATPYGLGLDSPSQKLEKARIEFYKEKAKNPVFRRELYDINYNIRYDKAFEKNRKVLSIEDAWQGVMHKAWDPVKYIPHAIVKGVVLKDSIQEDAKAAYFIRISVQHPFQKINQDKYTVVREEVSIDKVNKLVYFMGRPALPSDYKTLNIDPNQVVPQIIFLDEHKIVEVDNDPVDVWTLVALPTKGFTKKDQIAFTENLAVDAKKPQGIYEATQKLFSKN